METPNSKDEAVPKYRYMPSGMDRPPLEKWIEDDREKKWQTHLGRMDKDPKYRDNYNRETTFYPEYYIPGVGVPLAFGILGYRLLMVKRRKISLPDYLIHTRVAVQGLIIISFVGMTMVQTVRYVNRTYFNKPIKSVQSKTDIKAILPKQTK